jgi:hypothetical protein
MSEKDWTGCKEEKIKEFLLDHYDAWLGGCTEEECKKYENEIAEAASLLSVGQPANCCDDDLFFETVTFI